MTSWLDIYPVVTGAAAPKQDKRVASRVTKLRATLEHLKEKIKIRQQIVRLSETNGLYCTTCGSRPPPRYCSTTCPLLKVGRGWQAPQDGDRLFLRGAKKDVQSFWALARDVEDHGLQANAHTVRGWEADAVYLVQRTMDVYIPQRKVAYGSPPGLDIKWDFKDNWGKRPVIEDELAPDEMEKPTGEKA